MIHTIRYGDLQVVSFLIHKKPRSRGASVWRGTTRGPLDGRSLAAAGGGAAFHAAVAGAVAGHDGSAGGAGGGVSHVVHLFHGGGGVVEAAVFDSQGVRS